MLRNLLLTALLTLATLPAQAENKTDLFAAFYSYNSFALRPHLTDAMMDVCMKQKNDKAYCGKSVPSNVEAVIAYYTYRMSTEKSDAFFQQMVACGKDDKSSPECPKVVAYIKQVHLDFGGVVESMKKLAAKQN